MHYLPPRIHTHTRVLYPYAHAYADRARIRCYIVIHTRCTLLHRRTQYATDLRKKRSRRTRDNIRKHVCVRAHNTLLLFYTHSNTSFFFFSLCPRRVRRSFGEIRDFPLLDSTSNRRAYTTRDRTVSFVHDSGRPRTASGRRLYVGRRFDGKKKKKQQRQWPMAPTTRE